MSDKNKRSEEQAKKTSDIEITLKSEPFTWKDNKSEIIQKVIQKIIEQIES